MEVVVEGVNTVKEFGVFVKLLPDGPTALLHLSNISREWIDGSNLASLFTPGEKIKVCA